MSGGKLLRFTIFCSIFLYCFIGKSYAALEFLPPEKAFPIEVTWVGDSQIIRVDYQIVKGYYLYKESLHYQMGMGNGVLKVIKPLLPKSTEKFDKTFQKQMRIYKEPFDVDIDLGKDKGKEFQSNGIHLQLELQGCAEAGICYPPMTLNFVLAAPGVKVGPLPEVSEGEVMTNLSEKSPEGFLSLWRDRDDVNAIGRILESASTAYLFLAFFILGLALAFTPCVLPMLPILSSVIFGTQDSKVIKKSRAIVLAVSYVLGMAIMYASAGILMAALGGGVQSVLQSPVVLIGFAFLLLILSGSLFGFYGLHLPHSWHQWIDRIAGRQKGGSIIGAFALGSISTLVASPCITAPLAGVLGFIAQTGSMTLGGGLLFVMALGMGLPLLFIAIEARILIPSTGKWMVWLQRFLGALLVALAIWIVSPLVLHSRNSSSTKPVVGSMQVRNIGESLKFAVVRSTTELDEKLEQARLSNKPVILDFYADWCISCREMELNTLSNAQVSAEMQKFALLQADVTLNNQDSRALLKRFGLFGPPGILFFGADGLEQKTQRVIGYMPPKRFLEHLKK